MRVRLTPGTADAGGTRIFIVAGAEYDTTKNELTMICRDGKICIQLVGLWQMSIRPSWVKAMSVDEVERIHDGRALVTVN